MEPVKKELSNLLITEDGTLIILLGDEFEVVGVEDFREKIIFKLKQFK